MRSATAASLVICLIGFAPSDNAAPLPKSVSTSRQFIVYGPDAQLRGALCDLAERTKATALHLLLEKDSWTTPIVLNAHFSQANQPELPPASLRFGQTGFGLKLQLDLSIAADVSAPAVKRELLRAIYLEMMYRQHPDISAGTAFTEPPDWLLDGTIALESARELSDLKAIPMAAPSLGEFLQRRPGLLESPSRVLYRAYATALLKMLTETAGGPARLARFLADLPRATNDPLADLQAHFPELGGSVVAAEKTWQRAIAQQLLGNNFPILDCQETERQLAQTLQITVGERARPPMRYSLEEFSKYVSRPDAAKALKDLSQELVVFSGRANPLYLPVIFEYEKIIAQLARRKTKRIAKRLAEARSAREQISRTMQGIDDYMNWFEVTQSRTTSGAFRDYLKAAEVSLEAPPRRRDPISVYLDAFEPLLQP